MTSWNWFLPLITDNYRSVASDLCSLAKEQGSRDNISVIVVYLKEPHLIAKQSWPSQIQQTKDIMEDLNMYEEQSVVANNPVTMTMDALGNTNQVCEKGLIHQTCHVSKQKQTFCDSIYELTPRQDETFGIFHSSEYFAWRLEFFLHFETEKLHKIYNSINKLTIMLMRKWFGKHAKLLSAPLAFNANFLYWTFFSMFRKFFFSWLKTFKF